VPIVFWSDANLSEEPTDVLAQRITDLETSVSGQLAELRHEVGLAVAAMRDAVQPGVSPFENLEQQLANAVTVSLSAALEAIRQSLTKTVADAIQRLEASPVAAEHKSLVIEEVAGSLQHAVLLALTSFEQSIMTPPPTDPEELPATVRDMAGVNQRIEELHNQLFG
jgi:hypothetical protein